MTSSKQKDEAMHYRRSWEAKQRILANPSFMAMLRRKLAALRERTGR